MSFFPDSLQREMDRLGEWSRIPNKAPTELAAYEAAEARFDEKLRRFNATLARQQLGVNELVLRGQYDAVRPLLNMHAIANAQARF